MRFVWIISLIMPIISCLSPQGQKGFFIEELIPESGEFEDTFAVSIRFSRPLDKSSISSSDFALVGRDDQNLSFKISDFTISEDGTLVTLYSEDAEPDKYYKLKVSGKLRSEDMSLLSYYYHGDFVSAESYFIKKKANKEICLVINEVLNYPASAENKEFIEIFNCSDEDVDLRGFYIKIDDNRPQRLLFRKGAHRLKSKGYGVILSDFKEDTDEPKIFVQGKFGKNGLSNSNLKSIELFDEMGRLISTFSPPLRTKKGISFERINPYIKSNNKNWGYSVSESGSTPQRENSIFMKDIFPPELVGIESREDSGDIVIYAEFDENIVCESGGCIYLFTPDGGRIFGSVEVFQKSATIRPTKKLLYSTEYTVVLTPLLSDLSGNSYSEEEKAAKLKTPDMPPIRLIYPSWIRIPSNTKYLEFISREFNLSRDKVYLAGEIQKIDLFCIESDKMGRFLCTMLQNPEGPEDVCVYVNNERTDVCFYLSDIENDPPPELKISNYMQIRDLVYIEADSSIPCILFADLSYVEDLDESHSYSSYTFSQHFEYTIKIQDPYKEYYLDIYCLDAYNNSSEKTRSKTKSYTEDGLSLIINEVLPNPRGVDTDGEFIEIYNNGNRRIYSSQISIGDCSDKRIKITSMSRTYIEPQEKALIVANNSPFFKNNEVCAILSGADKIIGRDLKNTTPERLCLYVNDSLVDYYYSPITGSKEDRAIERIDYSRYFDSTNWKISDIPGGTPCK